MMEIRQTVDDFAELIGTVRQQIPPQYLPNPTWAAVILVAVGVILAVFGARLLRTAYVTAFLAAGGAVGVRIAQHHQVDMLIGLVLGALLAGLIGHLMFRWWVAVTAGACAVLILAATAGPKYLPSEMQAFKAYRVQAAQSAAELPEAAPSLDELSAFYWGHRHDVAVKALVVAGLAFLCGLGFGLVLPRLTVVVGTSLIGVLAILLGGGALVTMYRGDWWDVATTHPPWFLGAVAVLLVVSLVMQTSRGPVPASSSGPAPTPAAA